MRHKAEFFDICPRRARIVQKVTNYEEHFFMPVILWENIQIVIIALHCVEHSINLELIDIRNTYTRIYCTINAHDAFFTLRTIAWS